MILFYTHTDTKHSDTREEHTYNTCMFRYKCIALMHPQLHLDRLTHRHVHVDPSARTHTSVLYIEPLKQCLRGQSRSQAQTTVIHVCSTHVHTQMRMRVEYEHLWGKSGDWLML